MSTADKTTPAQLTTYTVEALVALAARMERFQRLADAVEHGRLVYATRVIELDAMRAENDALEAELLKLAVELEGEVLNGSR